MPNHPESEMVAVSWLRAALSPFTGVATSLPVLASWPVLGGTVRAFCVVDSVVGGQTGGTAYRQPVMSVSTWAAVPDSDNPQWGAAGQLMARIVDRVLTDWTAPALAWSGYNSARVSSSWLVSPEPRRIPDQDSGRAHYVLDLGLAWTEVPA